MNDVQSPSGIAGSGFGLVMGLLIAGLLLRSACDLCGVDPSPSYLRCLVVALIQMLLNAALGFGMGYGVEAVATAIRLPDELAVIVGIGLTLLPSALLSTLINLIAFRAGFIRSFFIWLVDLLLNLLVMAIIVLILLGVAAMIGGIDRLF